MWSDSRGGEVVQEPQALGGHLPPEYQREASPWLTHEEAILRSQTLSNVVYRLDIDLTNANVYTAGVVIEFDYQPSPFPLTLDFLEGTVESIELGSQTLPVVYNGTHITIASRFLNQGRNSLSIRYSHRYSDTGAGLYRYVDSTDERIYLYTHFEPYDANRLVPSLDQPNLRARWLLSVRVPNDWQVVSAVREESIDRQDDDAVWKFPITPQISSYILPLHAGQYHVWKGMAGDIPLRLFARESLAQQVRAEWLLDLTAQGMDYFQAYFDEPYPFLKYDQLLVPDFNIGGMENVAAVTYTENFIPHGAPTRERLQRIANTFLHELSHMWFGDLVTIDWWNALWLKESFASLMAPMALSQATDFDEPWLTFYLRAKQLAYDADQRVTTHPIEMGVRDTKSGVASFDAITYRKGASVLKQLNHFLGEETFREGVRQYINRHAWQAAKLPDFMDTLEQVSGRDLKGWTRDWLETAGLNTVQAEYECQDEKIATFRLLQTAPNDFPTLRNHRLQAGIFQIVDGVIELQRAVAVELSGASTSVSELIGEPCPLLVYPNVGDWAFIRVQLDQHTLQRVPEQLDRIADPLLRSMFWQSLWDAVRDVNATLSDYLDIALSHLPAETNTTVLQQLLVKLDNAQTYLYLFGDDAAGLRGHYLPALETMAWQQVLASEAGSGRQKQWFDAWLNLAGSAEALANIERWLNGESEPQALNQDQDRRWQALIRLSANAYPGTDDLRDIEKHRDQSDTGKMVMITMAAAWPQADAKLLYLNAIDDPHGNLTSAMLKASMQDMFSHGQEDIHRQFAQRILRALPQLDKTRDQQLVRVYVSTILPALCTAESLQELARSIEDSGALGLIASKALRDSYQDDQRCVAMAARELGARTEVTTVF